MTQELVQLKYNILVNRIGDIGETLRLMVKLIDCQEDIDAIHIIFIQYEKMYKAVLASGEYDKYQEVEDIIISKASKIEAKLDKYIYKLAKQYPEYIRAIESSENYKNFGNLDDELLKIYSLKRLLVNCKIYQSHQEQDKIKQMLYEIKFKVLIRKQIKQMVYENGRGESNLLIYHDDDEELTYYMNLLEQAIKNNGLEEDDIFKHYSIDWIVQNSRLLNHVVYRLLEQDIEVNPEKYISLLEAKIFNPHMCNIANNPFKTLTPYAEKYFPNHYLLPKREFVYKNRAYLSLLLAVLKDLIGDDNMTIMDCSKIYERFGFECRPIVFYEGQEIIRRIFEKVKNKQMTLPKGSNPTKGKYCKIDFIGYNYNFDMEEEEFFTEAQIYHNLRKALVLWFEDLDEWHDTTLKERPLQLKGMRKILELRNPILESMTKTKNEWARIPLEQMTKLTETELPKVMAGEDESYYGDWIYHPTKIIRRYKVLWDYYKLDFQRMGVRIELIERPEWEETPYVEPTSGSYEEVYRKNNPSLIFKACINLDDISDLPIDYDKIHILTQEELGEANKIEGNER